jgi:hypothetical protein
MTDEVKVDETTQYESLIGVKEPTAEEESPFLDLLPELEQSTNKEWKKHWVGMPEFKQEENPAYKTIYVHFRNEEDYKEFSKLIDQSLTDKTKSIWHPKLDREANALRRWIETND